MLVSVAIAEEVVVEQVEVVVVVEEAVVALVVSYCEDIEC